jgi:UDP-4-amino-4,6-dideoxy-N-acetyl-beta-L-altrosamine transaminase
VSSYIPYGKQSISNEDINAVVDVLSSDWLTTGPNVTGFEGALKEYCGTNYVIVVCNATAALHLAYLALDVGEGDVVWTSPNTFLSTANAALMCGAQVDFVDVDPETYNMSVENLEQKLINAKNNNCLPKVVAPVHFAGQSCDMRRIHELSLEYDFNIVEDAAHAVGGEYLNQPVGSCQYSDITIFSFHPVKIITTGEGGALLTNDKNLGDKISLLRGHGMTRDDALMDKKSEGAWYHQMIDLGYNYRITDIQCALGLSQMSNLDAFVSKRHAICEKYDQLLANVSGVTIPKQSSYAHSALHLYPIQVPNSKRRVVFDHLRGQKIGVNVHYIPVYLQPFYRNLGFKEGYCPNAEAYYHSAISLPMFPGLDDIQIEYVVSQVKAALLA